MPKNRIKVKDQEVKTIEKDGVEYICLTDLAKTGQGNHHDIVKNYFKNRSNIEFLGLWEDIHNPNFNWGSFDLIKSRVGLNNFSLSTKQWIKTTEAIGLEATAGRYGGTYAHKDIAIHFSTWLSPAAYLYLIKEFQRLKEEESDQKNLKWHVSMITEHIDEVRNLLDSIPGQKEKYNRISKASKEEE